MITGKVLWFDDNKGHGIILSECSKEFYVDISVTPNRQNLKRHQVVVFEHNKKISECLCAHKIQIIKDAAKK